MRWRWAIVSPDPQKAAVAADVLRTHADIELHLCADLDTLPAEVDGLLVFVDGAEPERLHRRIRQLREERPATAVLAAAADLDARHLGALCDAGACDFVLLPVGAQELLARIERLRAVRPAACGTQTLSPRLKDCIGSSPAFLRQIARLPVFAACDAGVLIIGETGTGKEICAQAVHYLSARAPRPWVPVNCGAIPTELIETELFGHVKGAYTNAHASRTGLVREAEGGTLFLDDVDCLPLAAQAKLLRFLQEREYRAVGSNTVQRADVRVIAASNLQLSALVARGQFRQDLFFRLNVLSLALPPLRERTEDIGALALHFIERFGRQVGRRQGGLTPAALQRLVAHPWPGNVRELQHVIERAVLMSRGPLLTADDIELDDARTPHAAPDSFQAAKARVVQQFERRFIEQVLAAHGGNVTHAAQAAKKNRRAFFELMRKYQIEPSRYRVQPA